MIEDDFGGSEGGETAGFSHGDFAFVVEAFGNPAGELFSGTEIVEQQLAVSTQGADEFLHGLDARAHGLGAPLIEELAGPGG
ncbi:hypothetical protein RM530_10145 [Algiphilus sp. W345]|uniref:Uncharacterized protein n=1 Tax=Banduia mediterranea TaxID=3075609 RepID=A0ABU2WIN1_9GAMM|nr:hypothetical protein [Algiphilus sp. W345]MDT0497722.1 hypothetical protein [Algiphilus sp. W345]